MQKKRTETSIKKQLQKIEKKVGMEYQKAYNKGSKDDKQRSRIVPTSLSSLQGYSKTI